MESRVELFSDGLIVMSGLSLACEHGKHCDGYQSRRGCRHCGGFKCQVVYDDNGRIIADVEYPDPAHRIAGGSPCGKLKHIVDS